MKSAPSTAGKRYARIVGLGHCLPERVLDNDGLRDYVDTSDEWIRSRTGIAQRHLAAEDQLSSDLALPAAKEALQAAQLAASDLDGIIFATTTPDRIYPSTACLLQRRLGGAPGFAFDVQAVCSGFLYALAVAEAFVAAGRAERLLVVGAEVYSHILDWNDRNTCVLFGDGAGAAVVTASDSPGIRSAHLYADGSYADCLTVNGHVRGGRVEGDAFTRMDGSVVYRFAVEKMSAAAATALAGHQADWLVLHQANSRIIEAVRKRLRVPTERTVSTVADHGNTSAASIPLALSISHQRFSSGDNVLVAAVGGGFTWGALLFTW